MIRVCAMVAALLATPATADFQVVPLPTFCTNSYDDLEKKFGEFVEIDMSKPDNTGVSVLYAQSMDWEIYAAAKPELGFCVYWGRELDGGV